LPEQDMMEMDSFCAGGAGIWGQIVVSTSLSEMKSQKKKWI